VNCNQQLCIELLSVIKFHRETEPTLIRYNINEIPLRKKKTVTNAISVKRTKDVKKGTEFMSKYLSISSFLVLQTAGGRMHYFQLPSA
jgi:hypothetical protein